MRIIDLSHVIRTNMPVFPGTPSVRVEQSASLSTHGFTESELHLTTHTGTHVDVPAHLFDKGMTISELELDCFVGNGWVIDCRDAESQSISRKMLERLWPKERTNIDFLLLCTGWSTRWGQSSYFEKYPVLTPDAATWLCKRVAKGVGIDCVSVDRPGDELPVHQVLLENGLVIVENLKRPERLAGTSFLFTCLPLSIDRADGSPVRAAALVGSES